MATNTSSYTTPRNVTLREWQIRALEQYFNEVPRDYVVTATPGAGKTTFALTLASQLMKMGRITRIAIVCPTDHLRTQWVAAAKPYRIVLDKTAGNHKKISPRAQGYVTTYAEVAAHPVLHQNRVELPHKTLVIFDEIHHAGDGLSWGEAIREAFSGATCRVSLTGTPFRTSPKERIPFVTYEEGEPDDDGQPTLVSVSDFAYTYGHALRDKVVRPVIFMAYSGTSTWRDNAGDVLTAELGQSLTQHDEQVAWRTALHPRGGWVPAVISAAASRTAELRTRVPDAGCLILASDQDHARQYATIVSRVTGEKPTVVLSDDPAASRKISAYRNGTGMFLIAVRMVSEGVDIPRLTTLVWLTSYRTPLFFAQAVGRIVRARTPHETGTVFIPTVRSVLTLAATMEEERYHTVIARHDRDPLDGQWDNVEEQEPPPRISARPELVHTEARFGHVVVSGKSILPTTPVNTHPTHSSTTSPHSTAVPTTSHMRTVPLTVPQEDLYLGLPGLLTPEQESILRAEAELNHTPTHTAPHHTLDVLEEEKKLREEIVSLTKQLSRLRGTPIPAIHQQLIHLHHHPTPHNEADADILRTRRDWLLGKLAL